MPFSSTIELSTLDGSNGFRINGEAANDYSGASVSAAGDINGDGIDDVVIGAYSAEGNSSNSGAAYVVFGTSAGFGATFELSALDGSNGFKINGSCSYDYAGRSVSGAGDVNGDGFDDLIVGAPLFDQPFGGAGVAYVIFGSSAGFPAEFDGSALDGSSGFRIAGTTDYDRSSTSVSGAGDVNGDGIEDIIVGAYLADPNGISSGAAYVVFGRSAGFPADVSLSSLDGSNGFRLNGEVANDRAGNAVSGAGDVNGDGIDDVIVGASSAAASLSRSGVSYVVFGTTAGFAAAIELSALDGSDGFKINGASNNDRSGASVSRAGDVNGDGIDDVIVGAPYADASEGDSGASYVVFGTSAGFAAAIELSSLDGSNGFRIGGASGQDYSGGSVRAAGDVSGDGVDDLIIGAHKSEQNGPNPVPATSCSATRAGSRPRSTCPRSTAATGSRSPARPLKTSSATPSAVPAT